jgi:hypothetical protein
MRTHIDRLPLYALLAIALAACTAGNTPDSGIRCPTTAAGIRDQILAPRCATANCHTGSNAANGLDLGAADLEARLIGVHSSACAGQILVVPGHPEQSYLIDKLTNAMPACGNQMRPLGDLVDPATTECLRQWITSLGSMTFDISRPLMQRWMCHSARAGRPRAVGTVSTRRAMVRTADRAARCAWAEVRVRAVRARAAPEWRCAAAAASTPRPIRPIAVRAVTRAVQGRAESRRRAHATVG